VSDRGSPDATVAVLARSWGARDETGWALRQVAGALACFADVHVVTPEGSSPSEREDGVFEVHHLASAPDTVLEARRDVLIEAAACAMGPDSWATSDENAVAVLEQMVNVELASCWEPATAALREIGPDVVVLADYRQAGAVRAIDKACPDVPLVAVPLLTRHEAMGHPAFAPLFGRATSAIVFTDSEMRGLTQVHKDLAAHHVGLPLSANRSVLREPNVFLEDLDYVLVISATKAQSNERSAAFMRLLRARFTRQTIALVSPNSFTVSRKGIERRFETVERGTDMLRLVAWARATVDLSPGRLFARRSLESLLYSTPIVVPSESRAREHAELGGGLWFDGPSDLMYCVDAMFDRDVSDALGAQGNAYAEGIYGSPDHFVDHVVSATGLQATAKPSK